MNFVREIEETRAQLLRTVNMEMDLLLEKLKNTDNDTDAKNNPAVFESVYPLYTNISFFKGKKPVAVIFENNRRVEAHTWKQVASVILKDCIEDSRRKSVVYAMRDKIIGNTRVILSKKPNDMRSPAEIDSMLYFETHYDTSALLKNLIEKILFRVDYDYSRISIAIRD